MVVLAHKIYLNTRPQSNCIGCFVDEVCSMQPKDMDSKYLTVVRSVYQLHENNIETVLPLI